MKQLLHSIALCLPAALLAAPSQMRLAIDFGQVEKADVLARGVGMNLSWLLDSDLHRKQPRPMAQALGEMQPGILRFPYGHLADNYLWHVPPYEDADKGLRPRVASLAEAPGKWTWAVRPDRSMPEAMDFDEYMALCSKIDAQPLVCVNALSHKYPGGPTYAELKQSAVEWVKYARRRGYRVAYWEVGNEVEHKENARHISMEEYVELYADFARAMKEADPGARIGPGILAAPAYYKALMRKCPELVDFAAVHQYVWAWQKSCGTYPGWRDSEETFITNIEKAAHAVGDPRVKLLVTETGVSAGAAAPGLVNNTFKALWCAELLLNELAHPAVGASFYWGTHTPWDYTGPDVEPTRDVALALRLRTNARTPTGEIVKLLNEETLAQFVAMPRVHGRVRAYAMRSADGGARAVFLLNKDDQPAAIAVEGVMAPGFRLARIREFAGRTPDDVNPTVRTLPVDVSEQAALSLRLAPLSLTIIRIEQ